MPCSWDNLPLIVVMLLLEACEYSLLCTSNRIRFLISQEPLCCHWSSFICVFRMTFIWGALRLNLMPSNLIWMILLLERMLRSLQRLTRPVLWSRRLELLWKEIIEIDSCISYKRCILSSFSIRWTRLLMIFSITPLSNTATRTFLLEFLSSW